MVRPLFGRSLLVCLLISSAISQSSRFEGQRVIDVQYDPPKQPLDPRDLANAQPVRKGNPLRMEEVSGAIDRLYATGRYDDIIVNAEPAPGGVIVRFVTKPRWFVGHVEAEGKMPPPPNRGSITNGTSLNLGDAYDPKALEAAERTIHRLFVANGLREATSKTEISRDDDIQEVNFTFVIKAGKRAKYERPVITGNTILSDETIIHATGWRIPIIHWYRQVTESLTRSGVNGVLKKYEKKDRLMATVRITNMAYDAQRRRVKPTLTINAGPKVNVKAVEAKVSQRTLKKYVPVFTERRVDNDLLVEGARNLRDYFQSQGYYDVSIDFRQHQEGPDQVVIEYVVSRGQRFKLVKVAVAGNHYFGTGIIRERMFLEPASFRLRHGRYSEAMRTKDEQNITNLYTSNGFRDAKVISELTRDYQGKSGDIAVTVRINEGPQWFVDKVAITGMKQERESEIRPLLSSLGGQPFSLLNVAVDRTAILTRYYSDGFPNATFRYRSDPAGKLNHVNLEYVVSEGERKYVRDVRITGAQHTRERLIEQAITIKQDEPMSLSKMTEGQRNLYNLGIFAKVDTAIQNPDGDTQYKHVLYDIEEANRWRLNFGVGAEGGSIGGSTTTINSPVSNPGFSPALSADISRLNLWGTGHFVTVRGRWSTFDQRASFDYVAPRLRNVEGRNVTFTLLYDVQQNIRTFTSTREEASLQVSQQFTKALTGLFRFTYRRVSTNNIAIPTLLVPLLSQPVRLGLVEANFAQDRRDNPADAHRGIYNTANISLASSAFGSQRSFLKTLFKDATYHPLNRNWVLARQTTFGIIQPFSVPAGIGADESIPLPERFFAGGNISHRGFPEFQAGPRDIGVPAAPGAPATQPTGFPLGGNAVFINNVELRFPLIGDNIGGVLFWDAGNVYTDVGSISFRSSQRNLQDFNYMVHAVGFGIRYKTPVGPIRVDLAYSINPPSFLGFKGTYEQLLQCGPNLTPAQLTQLPQCQSVQQNTGHFQFFFSIGQTF